MLRRYAALKDPDTPVNGSCPFAAEDEALVRQFQRGHSQQETGVFDEAVAQGVVACCARDGYRDSGASAGSLGYLYKIHIVAQQNRSIQQTGRLLDKDNNLIMTFTARLHGIRSDGTEQPWPDYGDGDYGLSEFAGLGNSVTGLIEADLNSPEDDPKSFGPYGVNRAVRGLEGNARVLLPHLRDGILVHTGEWPGWTENHTMPNSHGCIHVWPAEVKRIEQELLKLGVVERKNPMTGKDYPYKPQGLLSIEEVDQPGLVMV